MMRKLVWLALLTIVCVSCNRKQLTIADFDSIKKGMSYAEVVKVIGKPSNNVGSGFYVYNYSLDDGRIVSIMFADLASLMDARVFDPNTKSSTSLFERKLDDFDFLKVGMSLDEIEKQVGGPDRNVGSGVIIVVYDLSNGSKVYLGFGSDITNLLEASVYLPDGTVKRIVGDPSK